MQLPEVGSIAAVQYKRNPHKSQDPSLNPRLLLGRVLRHEGSWGFTAAFTNYDNVPQETWLEFDNEDQRWDDRNFQQPIESVICPVSRELEALHAELVNLPTELPQPEDGVRPFSEMRLRFLLGAAEAGWLKTDVPVVLYSDDFPDARSASASWHRQPLGRVQIAEDRIFFEWPIDDKDPAECGIELTRQQDGSFYAKSEEYGDEFHARFEQREGAQVLIGLWSAEEFLSFFAAVFPNS